MQTSDNTSVQYAHVKESPDVRKRSPSNTMFGFNSEEKRIKLENGTIPVLNTAENNSSHHDIQTIASNLNFDSAVDATSRYLSCVRQLTAEALIYFDSIDFSGFQFFRYLAL